MIVEQSVECELSGETEVLGENLPQCHPVHYKTHMTWPVPPRWDMVVTSFKVLYRHAPERLRKNAKTVSQNSWYAKRDSNWEPPEYTSEALPFQRNCSLSLKRNSKTWTNVNMGHGEFVACFVQNMKWTADCILIPDTGNADCNALFHEPYSFYSCRSKSSSAVVVVTEH
jgi:hypothetical protein